MVFPDKFKSFFNTIFHRKRNENVEPEDQYQSRSRSQSQNPNESQTGRPDKEKRNEHYDDTYGSLSEVAAPKPVEPGLLIGRHWRNDWGRRDTQFIDGWIRVAAYCRSFARVSVI